MPGFVPIQSDTAAHSPSGPLASVVVAGGFVGAFAAVLSGLLQPGRRSDPQSSVGAQPTELPVASSESSGELAVPAGDEKGVNATLPDKAVASPSKKVPDRSNRVPDDGGKIGDVAEKASDGVDQFSNGAGKVPDTTDKAPDSIGMAFNDSGTVPERPRDTPACLVSDSVGKAPDKDRKVPDGQKRNHTGTGKASNAETPPIAAPVASQSTPGAIPTAMLVPPPGVDNSVTAAPQIRKSDTQKSADPLRTVPRSPRDGRPAKPDQTDPPTPHAVSSAIDLNPDKFVGKSETSPLTTPSNVPQAPSPTTDTAPVRPLDQPAVDPASPTHQVAPALVGILKTTDGVQSVTVHLQPPELGQVQIRVDRTTDGAAHVDISAERPETLALLKRDEPALQQTLDQAGVLSNGRSISFQVAAPEQIIASASRTDNVATDSGSSGQQQSGGTWRQNDDGQRDPGNRPSTEQQQARARWFRAGLDITA